ncbi:MAG TPA: DUF389 domain-containing protein [Solirubrobacterales bacterium]
MSGGSEPDGGGRIPLLRGPWWFRRRRELTDEQRHSLLAQLYFLGPDRAPFLERFAVLLALAILLAVFGLAADSATVVIGAMVISPFTTPLLGLAAAIVMGWPRRLLESAAILAGATVAGVVVGWLALAFIPEPASVTRSSSILLAHTEPRLLDLGVALVAGAAGAFVLVRREAVGALPGVAIAVALVPPLASTGMMLALGEHERALQALLLFATNFAGIVFAASVMLLALGVRTRAKHARTTRVGLASAAVSVLVIAIPLALITAERARDAVAHDDVIEIARAWLHDHDLRLLDAQVEVDAGTVFLELEGPRRPESLQPLADRLADALGEPVELDADWVRSERISVSAAP